MNTQHAAPHTGIIVLPPESRASAFDLQELDQVELAITAAQDYLATLQIRRERLTCELERITRPSSPPAARRVIWPGFTYRGEKVRASTAIDIYEGLLRRLWVDYPEQREAIVRAMRARGYTRGYVGRSTADLFPGKQSAWAARFCRPLVDGWLIDTNLNRSRIATLLRVAVAAAGLRWGDTVHVQWRATRSDH